MPSIKCVADMSPAGRCASPLTEQAIRPTVERGSGHGAWKSLGLDRRCRIARMRAWTACLAMLSACGFATPTLDAGEQGGRACFGTVIEICFPNGAPTTQVTFPPTINTGDSTGAGASQLCDRTNESASTYCVIAGPSLTLPATRVLRGVGSRPLVLLSTSSIEIDALAIVDVASKRDERGASANPADCATTAAPTDSNAGGFGGSFGGKGGAGEPTGGPAATVPEPLSGPPADLRGGCAGGTGGRATLGCVSGAGGHGGGAVALIAAEMIRLNGTINASGAGGRGGASSLQCGGGGGGSGGMIVLDAPAITREVAGLLFANGGGGGQGAAGPGSGIGTGLDGSESPDPMTPAPGGHNANRDGGSGGDGSAGGTTLVGADGGTPQAEANGGGGGGGGGAGFIIVRNMTGERVISGDAVISPPAWPPPP
jgi:hypothetical protein